MHQQLNIFDLTFQPREKKTDRKRPVSGVKKEGIDLAIQSHKDAHGENVKLLGRYRINCRNRGLTDRTIEGICDNDLSLFIKFLGDKHIADVSHTDIEDFLLYCSDQRGNGDKAIARKYTTLHQFYKILIKQETIPMTRNPLDKIEKPKVRNKVRPFLTFEEYRQLMDYVDSIKDLRGAALLSLFYSSGCRVSEIEQQDISNLDFEARRFKVLGKGEKERVCMFSPDAKERILRYLASRSDGKDYLFISREGGRWSTRSIERYTKVIGQRAGLKKHVHPHLLRHGSAMHLLKQGVNLEVIQRLLGHSSIATTQHYARLNFDEVQSVVDTVEF